MTEPAYALVGLTAFVGVLVAVVIFALMRFLSAARDARRAAQESRSEVVFVSAALQDAVARLKTQGEEMSARAEKSQQLSDQIVGSLTSGLLVVDHVGQVEILNPAGRRLLAVTGDPLGIHYRELLARAVPLGDAMAECLTTRRPIVRRSLRLASEAGAVHLGVTVSPLWGQGVSQGVICLFSDLTSVMELEEQLRLKETLARLGELTAGIAHEFRNGLATIHGYSRLLDPQALPTSYRPYVEGIRQEADALGRVVTSFLDFARPTQVSFVRVALGPIARRVSDDLLRDLPPGTTIETKGDLGDILGDELLLRQAFSNLIRNAAEACAGAGTTAAIVIRGDVDLSHAVCRVAVEDNGPGIPEHARERVFQPFFTTRSQGTGLGLAIVQKIVVTHNGRVSVGSGPRGGASIQLSFPIAFD